MHARTGGMPECAAFNGPNALVAAPGETLRCFDNFEIRRVARGSLIAIQSRSPHAQPGPVARVDSAAIEAVCVSLSARLQIGNTERDELSSWSD